jgi:hypothetical protein
VTERRAGTIAALVTGVSTFQWRCRPIKQRGTMHHDSKVSIEIDELEQKSRAELRVLWDNGDAT